MEMPEPNMRQFTQKRVLFAALDWGLGHATRCIPLIDALLELGHVPVLASSGHALDYWKRYYPKLEFVELSSIRIQYKKAAWWSALMQSPHLLRRLMAEDKKLLKRYFDNHTVDFIVSDNRYGCWFPGIPAVLLSNQLDLLPPAGWQGFPARFWHMIWRFAFRSFSRPFQEIWVPEFEQQEQQLAGAMLYNPTKKPVRYIGLLSRLPETPQNREKKGTLLLLSGPEPQRTALENLLLAQRFSLPGPVTLVRGNQSAPPLSPEPGLQLYPEIVDPTMLARLLAQHRYVICRPGHSTLSDLYYSGAHFGVISTPGQPEQQYLASRLSAKGIAPNQPQEKLNVSRLIADIDKFTGFNGASHNSLTTLWQNVLNAL